MITINEWLTLLFFILEIGFLVYFYKNDDKVWMTILAIAVGFDGNTILEWLITKVFA